MPRDYIIKILLEPELRDDGFYVKETWSGPYEGLGSPWPVFYGPMPIEIVEPLMKERVQLLEMYKENWRADFEQRMNYLDEQLNNDQ